jgi:hypothetical protein
MSYNINVRENRRRNQEWTIQRNWQYLDRQDTGRRQTKKKEHNTEIWKDEQHRSLQKPGVNLDAREV